MKYHLDIERIPGPWLVCETTSGDSPVYFIEDFAQKHGFAMRNRDLAYQTVDCLNAMEGIENPEEFVRQGKASTELLEALEDLVCLAEVVMNHPESEYDRDGELKKAKAAIAKAKGGQ